MNKIYILKTIVLASVVISAGSCQNANVKNNISRTDKPNILFILIDDLGKEWISGYGAEDVKNPVIDNLAKTGMQFTNCYSMPQSTPSRMSLFTGQYPCRHGWVNHWDVPRWGAGCHFDETKNPSMARYIKKAGYTTAAAGKWQVDDFRVEPDAMTKHGFDDYCMWTGYESGNPASAERYWNPYIHTKSGSRTCQGEFGEDIFSGFLIDFIKKNKDKPMFMYYAVCLTHTPFTNTPNEPEVTIPQDCHKAMVRYVDHTIGKLINALENTGLRKNTIVMITTDNGTTGQIKGTRNGVLITGGKSKTTENGICEPMVINCPSLVPSGIQTDALIDFTDFLPTFAELTGATLPSNYHFDGKSFAPLLLGQKNDSPRRWIMSMGGMNNAKVSSKGVENQYKFRDRVIRNKQYKLYISSEKEPEKLFDLLSDPYETNNLINDSDKQTVVKELFQALSTMPKLDNDPLYIPNPPQNWDTPVTVESQTWKK